jgi:membrane-associated HD superfamily phosphohydrolase
MERRLSDRLLPWIGGSLLLLGVIVLVATQVPSVECGGETDVDPDPGTALLVVTIVSSVLAVAGALYRIIVMALTASYGSRDGWIVGGTLLVLAAAVLLGAVEGTAAAGLAIGAAILGGVAFVALLVAAIAGLGVEDVGLLLPLYLLGAAWIYLCFGVFVLFVTSGVGC